MRASVLTVAFALAVCFAPTAQGSPSVSVSPDIVAPGGKLTVKGKGWVHNARVSILIGPPASEATKVGTLRTTSRGKFKGTLSFKSSARSGRYVLLACRRKCAVKATARFRIADAVGRVTAAKCGYVDISGGRAWKIRATNVRCRKARKLARKCLKGTKPSGWTVSYNARSDRTTLRSDAKRVSFTLVGGGGCIPV